ncbi:ABC transporter family substrate-binding protein [Streptomyces boncukensis]|uniref:ABC transporter family substrate-binding protein n=1 Tax=Streptomyces boncukensis TaxID=2711219 RepID=A0A6G4X389_9ACTN|nr:ABC transporter family substrate-binding protein [Streptomyces boncukensis]NGO71317.1 ABC transporter family substrate-binding protein [Streptomyces boncukensis]
MLAVGVLLPFPLAGCGGDSGGTDDTGGGAGGRAVRDVPTADRDDVAPGGTLRWATDAMPTTFNAFQPDAGPATDRIAAATLPALFTLDEQAAPHPDPNYLEKAEVTDTEPRQTVVYTLNPKARWSDGRPLGVADFRAQWKALRGKSSAYWTARSAGYDRIRKVTRGEDAHQVKVVFTKPYADWQSLFTPLYPKSVMGDPDSFNDSARTALPVSAGPFRAGKADRKSRTVPLERNPRWWGERAKLDRIELKAVPRPQRAAALERGSLDLAEVDADAARQVARARKKNEVGKNGAGKDGAGKNGAEKDGAERKGAERGALSGYSVRRALDPAYTQLALNGAGGPLADERVRRAVARALDREELARQALGPVGLPTEPLGSHLRMANQDGYQDTSEAIGDRDLDSAQRLLADAGWKGGGPIRRSGDDSGEKRVAAGPEGGPDTAESPGSAGPAEPSAGAASAPHRLEAQAAAVRVGPELRARVTGKPLSLVPPATAQRAGLLAQAARSQLARAGKQGAKPSQRRARAALRRAERVRARAAELGMLADGTATAVRTKGGRPLALRFVLPAGPGSGQIRATGRRIAATLNEVGIRTQLKEVPDTSYFKDHIAAGEYDLALYSWPATAYPATEARPIFAKPRPAADGSLLVEQNYSRVGTDQIDQLFEQAAGELDEGRRTDLLRKADARIWAAGGSLPLYQRPQLVAAKDRVVNAGAFGFQTPRYQDIGFRTPES